MKLAKKILSGALALTLMVSLVACDQKNKEGIVATVNDQNITQEEYDESLKYYKQMAEAQYGENAWNMEISPGQTIGQYYEENVILNSLITEKLIYENAKKDNITMNEEDLQTELDTLKGYFSEEEYAEYLTKNNLTEDKLKEIISKDYIINTYVTNEIEKKVPTDEELQQMFDSSKSGTQIRASHILVDTEDEAKAVIDRINNGESFEDVAKDVSKDGSAQGGGDLGFFSYEDMVQPFSEAAFALEIGGMSGAVQSQFGYHVIKVTDKKEITLESKKEELIEQYKQEAYAKWIEELKNNAKIVKY